MSMTLPLCADQCTDRARGALTALELSALPVTFYHAPKWSQAGCGAGLDGGPMCVPDVLDEVRDEACAR